MSTQTSSGGVPEWTLGDRLRKAREYAGLHQQQLADEIGISRRSVSAYESSDTPPRRPVMLSWSLVTGVSLTWLQTGEAGPDDGPGGGGGVRHERFELPTRWLSGNTLHQAHLAAAA